MKRLYQIVPRAKKKDAIGKMAFALQELFDSQGQSLIFTESQQSLLGPLRKGLLKDTPWSGAAKPDMVFYHHSVGTPSAKCFIDWPAERKILIYHNITPPELTAGAQKRKDVEWGLSQLKGVIEASQMQVALSKFSCDALRAFGAENVVQLPYLLSSLQSRQRERAERPLVLMVGRVEPHKGFLEGIRAFQAFHKRYPEARMVIVGDTRANPEYVNRLNEEIRELPIQLTGKISNRKLARLYDEAWSLLVLSKHEGFCVPIVEALSRGLSVVALDEGAVKETLGRGGVLIDKAEVSEIVPALETVCFNGDLKATLQKNQKSEISRFSKSVLFSEYRRVLKLDGLT